MTTDPMPSAPSPASAPAPLAVPPRRWTQDVLELVSSMRFAIALLTLICVASVIGTVVKQHEPAVNYVNQFGVFWAPIFGQLGLYTVYSAPWFLVILAFLVVSTSLCVARNTPKVLADLRTYKEHVREQALKAFHHKAQGEVAVSREDFLARVSQIIGSRGWKAKAQVREDGVMVAARQGAANKVGYLAAHSAIVLICLGGLMDGDVIVKALMHWRGVTAFDGGGFIKDVSAQHRLPVSNPTFRGNMLVNEGGRAGVAVLNQADGVVLQELPFDIELKKFHVDFYATGMPKLFASDIVIHDHETGVATAATVKVNEPAFHRGVAIYQSSFEDGGSKLKLKAQPLGDAPSFEIAGEVGGAQTLTSSEGQKVTLEFTGLRVFNVENLSNDGRMGDGADVRRVDLVSAVEAQLGSGAHTSTQKDLRNIGPSVSYKLRDEAGQAREFNNYMVPVELDGQRVFLAGVRDSPSESFRYLRIPADDKDTMDTWLAVRRALAVRSQREAAVARYVKLAVPQDKPELAVQLTASAQRAMALYAGAERPFDGSTTPGGLPAMAEFVEHHVPQAEQTRASEVLIRILNGSLFELLNLTRERAGQSAMASDDKTQAFMTQMVLSLSDAVFYPAPYVLQLQDFQQIQASVFQLTRSPGKTLVYLGCVLLIVGVFAMLYVRERRMWVWIQDGVQAGRSAKYTVALSSTRQTLDTDREFEEIKQALADVNSPAVKEMKT